MIRLIQVGYGKWGRSWFTSILCDHEDAEVVACVDSDEAALAQLRKAAQVSSKECFPSLQRALEATTAEAVLVTTGAHSHAQVCEQALLAGKHVLVEKPFTTDLDEARQLAELADRRGLILMVAQNYRHYPAVVKAKDIVQRRELGRVAGVHYDFRSPFRWVPPKGQRVAMDLISGMAIHHFDLLRAILGCDARRVMAWPVNPSWRAFETPVDFSALLEFADEIVVNYRFNWTCHDAPTHWAGEARFGCEEGEFCFTSRKTGESAEGDRVIVYIKGEPPHEPPLPELKHLGRAALLTSFHQAIKNRTQPETSGRDNLKSLAIVSAVEESLRTGQEVRL